MRTPLVNGLWNKLDQTIALKQKINEYLVCTDSKSPGCAPSSTHQSLTQPLLITSQQVDSFFSWLDEKIIPARAKILTTAAPLSTTSQHHRMANATGQVGRWSKAMDQFLNENRKTLWNGNKSSYERILARLTLLLLHRLLPYFHGPGADEIITGIDTRIFPLIEPIENSVRDQYRKANPSTQKLYLPSFMHLYLFCHHLIGLGGKQEILNVLADPTCIFQSHHSGLSTFCVESALFFLGIFTPDLLAYHARKSRTVTMVSQPHQQECGGILPGFLSIYYQFLPREYTFICEEHRPWMKCPTKSDEKWIVDPTKDIVATAIAESQSLDPSTLKPMPRWAPGHVVIGTWESIDGKGDKNKKQ